MTNMRRRNNLSIALLFIGLCATVSIAQSKRGPSTQPPPPRPAPTPTDFKPASVAVDVTGSFTGQEYVSPALGFNLTLPQSWQAEDREVQTRFAERASEKVAENAAGRQPAAQASVARTTLLFVAVKPTDGKTNPIIMAMAEDIALVFSIRTSRQYLEATRSSNAGITALVFDDQITTEKIGGVEFSMLGASPTVATSPLRQRYYVTLRHNHAIAFVLTFHGDEELRACLEVLNSLKFD